MAGADTRRTCGNPHCTDYHPPRWVDDCAVTILRTAMRRDQLATVLSVRVAAHRMGGDDLWSMASLWANIWRRHCGITLADAERVEGFAFFGVDKDGVVDRTGRSTDVDAQAPGPRFAARFLLAAARRDSDQMLALANSVGGEPASVVDALTCLVTAVGLALGESARTGGGR